MRCVPELNATYVLKCAAATVNTATPSIYTRIAETFTLSVAPAATSIFFGTVEFASGVQIVTVRFVLLNVHGGMSHFAAKADLLSSGNDWKAPGVVCTYASNSDPATYALPAGST